MQNAFRGFTFVDESSLESQYNARYGNYDDDFTLSRSHTQEHRMSGVQRTGEDGIFNEENWEM